MTKKAFTMLELVMVIVVMGIVASIGADIIVKLYENYLKTRSINKLQAQTELVLDQIEKRLQFRIKDSVRAIDIETGNIVPLPDANTSHDIIEWIGISNESFIADGWSGFIDLDSNDTNSTFPATLKTPGSDLNNTNNIINALTYGDVSLDLSSTTNYPAIIFKNMGRDNVNNFYGQFTNNHTTKVVRKGIDTVFPLDDVARNNQIFEQYYLSHSAFAIVPVFNKVNDYNLTLRYNYQPWHGENYNTVNDRNTSLLIEHVSTFRFTQIGETIRVKLCIHDDNQSGDYNFAFCKEKVIY